MCSVHASLEEQDIHSEYGIVFQFISVQNKATIIYTACQYSPGHFTLYKDELSALITQTM